MKQEDRKKVFIRTFGCQMNERDSDGVKGLLLNEGYALTEDIGSAGVVLLNTCSVRQHAEERVIGRLGLFDKLKRERPEIVIGILGCMAQEHKENFFKRMPCLDFVCGPGNLHEVPRLIKHAAAGGGKVCAVDRIDDPDAPINLMSYRSHSVRASVNIMSGCDHRCTYCIVPLTRGKERSRASADIIEELRGLIERGYKDILLLGQNVNGYGRGLGEKIDFTGLLEKIQRQAPPERLRFTTSHPKDAGRRLFEAMRDLPSLCAHLHLPVQSGSSRVLKRMKREHTREWYLERVGEYRRLVPEGSLTTDIIAGFCGETGEDFEETKSLMREADFDSAYLFKYSPRPQTPAYRLPDDVPEDIKRSRLAELIALQRELTLGRNRQWIGRKVEVLFEDHYADERPRSFGRSRQFKRVVVHSVRSLASQTRTVIINELANETLCGELAGRLECKQI